MRKIVLLTLVSVELLLIGLILMSKSVSATEWTGLNWPSGISIGDYDNDGLNDLAFAEDFHSEVPGRVTVYRSDGTILKQWTGLNRPSGLAIGDYDNDGLNDIAITEEGNLGETFGQGNVTVYKSDGVTIIKRFTGLLRPTDVAIGDYDNDGLNDFAVVEYGNLTGGGTAAGNVTVYKSDGVTIIKRWTGFTAASGVDIGDYDNDGKNDIVITDGWGGTVTVYKSDGITVIRQWTGLALPHGPSIRDYDNDGLNDIAFAQRDGTNKWTVWSSNGTLIKEWSGVGPWGTAIGDYNNDGFNDIALSDYTGSKVIVYFWGVYYPSLTISTSAGGITNPSPGIYYYEAGTVVSVTAYPDSNYIFHHWELDGAPYGTANPTTVTMNTNHNLHAVFAYSPPPPGVGGYVIPVDKIGLLAPYIGLASTTIIGLTATIIYVKRFKHKKQKQ